MNKKYTPDQDSSDRPLKARPYNLNDQQITSPTDNLSYQPQESMHSVQSSQLQIKNDDVPGGSPMERQMQHSPIEPTNQVEADTLKKDTNLWINRDDADEVRSRWNEIQVQFVDSPCSAVEQGDTLVTETLERINRSMAEHLNSLNQQWVNHDDISTEELRITLQNYRTLLDRLLIL